MLEKWLKTWNYAFQTNSCMVDRIQVSREIILPTVKMFAIAILFSVLRIVVIVCGFWSNLAKIVTTILSLAITPKKSMILWFAVGV